jgi:cysteine desulfurase
MNRIYFDHAASTPILPEVAEAMHNTLMTVFGNPSSIHTEGRKARSIIEETRKTIAKAINASLGEVYFTSGGTEANNMVLKNAIRDLGVQTIISSPLEHHCITHVLDTFKDTDVHVIMLTPDEKGRLSLAELEKNLGLSKGKVLVSLMHGNNEIGNLLPLEAVGALCKEYNAYFHSDTVQTFGKIPIDVQACGLHFISGSAHKLNGPKGIGFVYINGDAAIKPYIHGGAQERNMRAGTENIPSLAGFKVATQLAIENQAQRFAHIVELKQALIALLQDEIEDITFNGDVFGESLPNIISLSFPQTPKSEMLLFSFDIEGFAVSGGSACSSGVDQGSHVIAALGGDTTRTTIRVSLSAMNTMDDLQRFVAVAKKLVPVSVLER